MFTIVSCASPGWVAHCLGDTAVYSIEVIAEMSREPSQSHCAPSRSSFCVPPVESSLSRESTIPPLRQKVGIFQLCSYQREAHQGNTGE